MSIKKCTGCGRYEKEPLGINKLGEPFLACCPDSNYKEVTAVEWLINEADKLKVFKNVSPISLLELDELITEAKQMHREQIGRGYMAGISDGASPFMGDECLFDSPTHYYNQTYGQ